MAPQDASGKGLAWDPRESRKVTVTGRGGHTQGIESAEGNGWQSISNLLCHKNRIEDSLKKHDVNMMFRYHLTLHIPDFLGLKPPGFRSSQGGNLLGGANQGVNERAGKITWTPRIVWGWCPFFYVFFVAWLNSERTIFWRLCVFVAQARKKTKKQWVQNELFFWDPTNQTCNENFCSRTLEAGQFISLNFKRLFLLRIFQYTSRRSISVRFILGRQYLHFGRS